MRVTLRAWLSRGRNQDWVRVRQHPISNSLTVVVVVVVVVVDDDDDDDIRIIPIILIVTSTLAL